jgi:cytochrome c553
MSDPLTLPAQAALRAKVEELRAEAARRMNATMGPSARYHEGHCDALRDVLALLDTETPETGILESAQKFVTLANTVWAKTSDGRAARRLAEKRMEELARHIMAQPVTAPAQEPKP